MRLRRGGRLLLPMHLCYSCTKAICTWLLLFSTLIWSLYEANIMLWDIQVAPLRAFSTQIQNLEERFTPSFLGAL